MSEKRTTKPDEIERLAAAVEGGERRALARAITLVESTHADHRAKAEALLARLMPATGNSIRLGISGSPGVGKSTFIEAFGLHLIGQGRRLAVLAVDPSSKRGGGSILGDKTRMEKLAVEPAAFIRPSPTGGALGGVARRTREAILVAEAAGFDVVIVETVGVGQSETAVADMVDMFILLLQPAGGDELQGLKRGIIELADLLVVNKADGELTAAAARAAADYRRALQLIMPRSVDWRTPVKLASALTGKGIADVLAHRRAVSRRPHGERRARRPARRAGARLALERARRGTARGPQEPPRGRRHRAQDRGPGDGGQAQPDGRRRPAARGIPGQGRGLLSQIQPKNEAAHGGGLVLPRDVCGRRLVRYAFNGEGAEFCVLLADLAGFLVRRRIEPSLNLLDAVERLDGNARFWRLSFQGSDFPPSSGSPRGELAAAGCFDGGHSAREKLLRISLRVRYVDLCDTVNDRLGLSMEALDGDSTKSEARKHRQRYRVVRFHGSPPLGIAFFRQAMRL